MLLKIPGNFLKLCREFDFATLATLRAFDNMCLLSYESYVLTAFSELSEPSICFVSLFNYLNESVCLILISYVSGSYNAGLP